MDLKKGDIVLVQSPADTKGTEVQKTRPAIVISPSEMAQFAKRVIVVPMTSNVSKIYPFESKITSSIKPSKACCDQIQTVSMIRIIHKFGSISEEEIEALDHALRNIFDV